MKLITTLTATAQLISGIDLRAVICTVLILIIIGIVITEVVYEIENVKRY